MNENTEVEKIYILHVSQMNKAAAYTDDSVLS